MGQEGGTLINSHIFVNNYDRVIVEDVLNSLRDKSINEKEAILESFVRGLLFGLYHEEGTKDDRT